MNYEIIKNVYICKSNPVCRLILGDRMDSKLSEIEKYNIKGITGTIGFMDYQISDRVVPKKDAPIGSKNEKDFVLMKSFTILLIGIEPKFRRNNFFNNCVELGIELAKKHNCECLVLDTIQNEKIIQWAIRKNFKPYFNNAAIYF